MTYNKLLNRRSQPRRRKQKAESHSMVIRPSDRAEFNLEARIKDEGLRVLRPSK